MSVLVVGNGAEDAEDDLGRAVLAAATRGVAASGIHVDDGSRLRGTVDDVVAWALPELGVETVMLALPEAAGVPVRPGPEVVRGSRQELISALSALVPPPAAHDAVGATDRPGARDRAPRVSMLITAFQHEAYLDDALRSCLVQTYDDHEVVVIDDGSSDATPSILERYAGHPRVRIITQENIGWTGQIHRVCNQLVRAARGELIAWLGGDDVNFPHRLAAQVEAFDEDPGLDVCHGAALAIGASGDHLGQVWNLERGYDDLSALREMMINNLVGSPSSMIRAGAFQEVGLYEQGLMSDYSMWLKGAGRLRFRYLPRQLVQYRLHPQALSTSADGFPRAEKEALRLRGVVLRRRTLDDLFPELGDAGPLARYEAALSWGNRLLAVDPRLALHLYDLAGASSGGPDLEHDRAVAHAVAGDVDTAIACAEAAAALDPTSRPLLRALRDGTGGQLAVREPRRHLDPALQRGRARWGSGARRWDGTPLAVERAWVAIDPARPDLAARALRQWATGTREGSPVRWTLPDLGQGVETVLEQVAGASGDLDLSCCAELAIEAVDDLALLPPEPDRPTGVLRAEADGVAFEAWLAARTGASA